MGADEHGGGDEELGDVDVERRLRRTQRGRGELDDDWLTLVVEDHTGRIEAPVRDSGSVHHRDLTPELHERPITDLVGRRQLQRIAVGLSRDDACVAALAERGDDDLRHTNTGLGRHQSGQRLVLDLLQAPDRRAPTGIAVRQQAPPAGETLRVLGVASKDADADSMPLTVVTGVRRRAHLLSRHRAKVVELDADVQHRVSNIGRRRDAGRRSEDQSDERTGPESQCHRPQHVGRQRCRQGELADTGCDDEPGEECPDWPDELGPDNGDDRDGRREPVLREAPSRPQVVVDG